MNSAYKKTKKPSEILSEKLEKIDVSESPKSSNFDLNKFVDLANEVKKLFLDEDINRFPTSI